MQRILKIEPRLTRKCLLIGVDLPSTQGEDFPLKKDPLTPRVAGRVFAAATGSRRLIASKGIDLVAQDGCALKLQFGSGGQHLGLELSDDSCDVLVASGLLNGDGVS